MFCLPIPPSIHLSMFLRCYKKNYEGIVIWGEGGKNNTLSWQLDFVSYQVINASYFTQNAKRYKIAKHNLWYTRVNKNPSA